MKDVKIQTDGTYKYKNVKFVDVPHSVFTTMVMVEKGPARLKDLIGRKYVTLEKAVIAVDVLSAESLISKGFRDAQAELEDLGLTHEMTPEQVAENPQIDILT
jgi:hypothetical protein